jgi:hypothetical protein
MPVCLHAQSALLVKCVPVLRVLVIVIAIRGSTRLVKQQLAHRVPVDLPVQIRQVTSKYNVNLELIQLVNKWRAHHAQPDRE